MTQPLHLEFDDRPSAAAYMLGALAPHPGLRRAGRFPPVVATWRRARLGARERADFLALCGPEAEPGLALLLPHFVGLRLQMAVLTHRAFPLPIWKALQIRNHLLLHRPIPAGADVGFETRVDGQRILEKGAEVDLRTSARCDGLLAWEGLSTFYYRGRHGPPGEPSPRARSPEVGARAEAHWSAPAGMGWRAGALSGDYNPLHWWRPYARRSGFRGPFLHPPVALGQCLARLPAPGAPAGQRLDAWLKGPVYERAAVSLAADAGPEGTRFALAVDGDDRPAILGHWCAARPGETLDGGAAAGRSVAHGQ